MKQGNWLRITVLILAVSVLHFCSVMSLENGIPLDQITWAKWNPEVIAELEAELDGALPRRARGFESKKIRNHEGGTVGGRKTFGNVVEVPEYAFDECKSSK